MSVDLRSLTELRVTYVHFRHHLYMVRSCRPDITEGNILVILRFHINISEQAEDMNLYLEDNVEAPLLGDVAEDAFRTVQTPFFVVDEPNPRTQVFREGRNEVHEAGEEEIEEMVVVGGQVAVSRLSRPGLRIGHDASRCGRAAQNASCMRSQWCSCTVVLGFLEGFLSSAEGASVTMFVPSAASEGGEGSICRP
jgi:hypothetical protein